MTNIVGAVCHGSLIICFFCHFYWSFAWFLSLLLLLPWYPHLTSDLPSRGTPPPLAPVGCGSPVAVRVVRCGPCLEGRCSAPCGRASATLQAPECDAPLRPGALARGARCARTWRGMCVVRGALGNHVECQLFAVGGCCIRNDKRLKSVQSELRNIMIVDDDHYYIMHITTYHIPNRYSPFEPP